MTPKTNHEEHCIGLNQSSIKTKWGAFFWIAWNITTSLREVTTFFLTFQSLWGFLFIRLSLIVIAKCKGTNEVYDTCPGCSPQTCATRDKVFFCPLLKCKPACRCKRGFFRNVNGECVSAETCGKVQVQIQNFLNSYTWTSCIYSCLVICTRKTK